MDDTADRLAIQDTLVRYATALDSKDWALFRDVWVEEPLVHYPGGVELRGFEAVRDFCAKALDRFRATQHLLGNYRITVSGNAAASVCSLQATHVPAEAPIYVLWGYYTDELVRTADGWRIAHRTLESIATERRGMAG